MLTPELLRRWIETEPDGRAAIRAILCIHSSRLGMFLSGTRRFSVTHALLYQLRQTTPELLDLPPSADEYRQACERWGIRSMTGMANLVCLHLSSMYRYFSAKPVKPSYALRRTMGQIIRAVEAVPPARQPQRLEEIRELLAGEPATVQMLMDLAEQWSMPYMLRLLALEYDQLYLCQREQRLTSAADMSIRLLRRYPELYRPPDVQIFCDTLAQDEVTSLRALEFLIGKRPPLMHYYRAGAITPSCPVILLFEAILAYLDNYSLDSYYRRIIAPVCDAYGIDLDDGEWPSPGVASSGEDDDENVDCRSAC